MSGLIVVKTKEEHMNLLKEVHTLKEEAEVIRASLKRLREEVADYQKLLWNIRYYVDHSMTKFICRMCQHRVEACLDCLEPFVCDWCCAASKCECKKRKENKSLKK